jgi:hypothetical protein
MRRYGISAVLLLSVFLLLGSGCTQLGLASPDVVVLESNPPVLSSGQSATLIWNVTGATSVYIDQGIGNVPVAGTHLVYPTSTTTYTVTARNSFGTVTRSVVVTVITPITAEFKVEPTSINAGGAAELQWNVSGATSLEIDQGIGVVPFIGVKEISPDITTTYTLTAGNDYSTVIRSIVLVVNEPPVVAFFEADPDEIEPGRSTTLTWDVTGADQVKIEPYIGNVNDSGTREVYPTSTTTYVLTASSSCCTISKSVFVTVGSGQQSSGLPVIELFAVQPGVVQVGQIAILEWYVTGASSVTINRGIGPVSSSGNIGIYPSVGISTYTLTAINSNGSVQRSVSVVVVSP